MMKGANFEPGDQPLRAQAARLVPLWRYEAFRLREFGRVAGSAAGGVEEGAR